MTGINEKQHGLTESNAAYYLSDSIDLHKLWIDIHRHLWLILSAGMLGLLITGMYTLTLKPIYQTTAMLQINMQPVDNTLSELGYRPNNISLIDTELALIPTSYILKPVVEENVLNIIILPHYFPVIGEWVASHHQQVELSKPFLGLKHYAWGGEKIQIKQFSVPDNDDETEFLLINKGNNHYELYSKDKHFLLAGKVGEMAYSSIVPGLTLLLLSLKANTNAEFFIKYEEPIVMANELAEQLKIKKVGVDPYFFPYQSTGVLQLTLTGLDPKKIIVIMNAILSYSITKNLEQKTIESQKVTDFLKKQLPELKYNLLNAENTLNQYYSNTGTLNSSQSSQVLLEQLNKVKDSLEMKRSEIAGLLQVYTDRYPLVIVAKDQEKELTKKLNDIMSQVKNFPMLSQKEMDLKNDIEIKNTMYLSLLRKLQQLEVANAGIVGDITMLNSATPATLISAHRVLKSVVGLLVGIGFAVIIVIIKNIFSHYIEDTDEIENSLKIPVQVTLPYSKKQKILERQYEKNKMLFDVNNINNLILAKQDPKDAVIENLRSLKSNLSMLVKSNSFSIITFLGSQMKVGKSFISLNFSQVIADLNKRTLLIDADLRKGRLHRIFCQSRIKGLGEYLEGKYELNEIIRPINDHLSFIASGIYENHPVELLASNRFQSLLNNAKQYFSYIIIDTSPISAVTDSLMMACHSDINIMVIGSMNDDLGMIRKNIKQAEAYGVKIHAAILNYQQPITRESTGYAYYQYAYDT